ncbi:MAG: hypothetical protein WDO17_17620 [Alphaproteobacteria bacterium]
MSNETQNQNPNQGGQQNQQPGQGGQQGGQENKPGQQTQQPGQGGQPKPGQQGGTAEPGRQALVQRFSQEPRLRSRGFFLSSKGQQPWPKTRRFKTSFSTR